jgi:hypothetical protein
MHDEAEGLPGGSGLLAGVLLVAGVALPTAAGARPHTLGPYKVKELRVVSGPSPFPAGCPGARFDDTAITGHELEPMITVNPANPRNLVATWKQDVGEVSPGRTDMVASSLDGGKTWTRSTIPGLTKCTGGTADAVSDPWVSAGGDDTVYFSGTPAELSSDPPPVAVVASRSRDGGRTWAAPVTVAAPRVGNDTDRITGSPTRAGHAYLAWANFLPNVLPRTNSLEFSRTVNGGATWSRPVLIDRPSRFALDFAPRIVVLPGGQLLAVFARADFQQGLGELYAARSLDEGRTWRPRCWPVLGRSPPSRLIRRPAPRFRRPSIRARQPAPTAACTSRSRRTRRRPQAGSALSARGMAAAPGGQAGCRG